MYNNKICYIVLNKFMLNEEAIKISNKIKVMNVKLNNDNININKYK